MGFESALYLPKIRLVDPSEIFNSSPLRPESRIRFSKYLSADAEDKRTLHRSVAIEWRYRALSSHRQISSENVERRDCWCNNRS